jgi:tRNA-specific 2-thiouridylase
MSQKVLVAMSGGVDSSVAAALLKEQGWDVQGLHFELLPPGEQDNPALASTQQVCKHLGIPLKAVDYRQEFGVQVVEYFVREYARGRTPNPCVFCNRLIKFNILVNQARELDARSVATGHYAITEHDKRTGRYLLKKGAAADKDQSYFLFRLTQEQLALAQFPVGGMTKDQVRVKARELNLPNAERTDSQEVCFVPGDDYKAFLLSRDPDIALPGDIVDLQGKVLGKHQGLAFYTVGQRKGLGIAHPQPLYVVRLEPGKNQVIVGDNEDLNHLKLTAGQVNWVSIEPPAEQFLATVKIRYRHEGALAVITPLADGKVEVVFNQPQRAITPGQAAVFYKGEVVAGGGIIESYGD